MPEVVPVPVAMERSSLTASLRSFYTSLDPVFRPFSDVYATLRELRRELNLPNPGTVEKLQNEVKGE